MFQGAYIYSQWRQRMIPDIYVQDYTYFDEYRDEIRKLYGDGIGKIDKIAIHVRRGDYIDNPFYVDLSKIDYYRRAINEFPNEKFIVLSDDVAFCKKYFMEIDKCEFSLGDELEDLNMMASCKGIIMSNSSFSWWAAYLSNAKVVIAPKEWHTDKIERTKLLPEWKII